MASEQGTDQHSDVVKASETPRNTPVTPSLPFRQLDPGVAFKDVSASDPLKGAEPLTNDLVEHGSVAPASPPQNKISSPIPSVDASSSKAMASATTGYIPSIQPTSTRRSGFDRTKLDANIARINALLNQSATTEGDEGENVGKALDNGNLSTRGGPKLGTQTDVPAQLETMTTPLYEDMETGSRDKEIHDLSTDYSRARNLNLAKYRDLHVHAQVFVFFLYGNLVTVLVGPNEYRFDVYKETLCSSSAFFRAALCGNFIEKVGLIRLPEQDPSIFKYFIHWLYNGSLRGYFYPSTFSPSLDELRSELRTAIINEKARTQYDLPLAHTPRQLYNKANYYDVPFSSLIGLYILADVLQVQGLKDPIINTLVENYDYPLSSTTDITSTYSSTNADNLEEGISFFWSLEALKIGLESPCTGINMAWETLGQDSRLCKALVAIFCNNVTYVTDERFNDGKLNADFLLNIAETYARRMWIEEEDGTCWDKEGVLCSFHEHERMKKCPLPALDFDKGYVFAERRMAMGTDRGQLLRTLAP
ncbi:hypothetical protein P7C71_g718, partial [Lecanoromycetidae sp. Uapishka_2]